MTDTTRDRLLTDLTKQLADEGRLIEAGWIELQRMAVPADAPPVQIREMRNAYMAGAQHLWSSLLWMLDPDAEPTADDMRRISLIAAEMDTWGREVLAAAERGRW